MDTGAAVLDDTFQAEAAITLYQCVKPGTAANEVNVCGAGEIGIGFAQAAQATADDYVRVRLMGKSKAVGAVTITKGALLKGAAAGQLTPAVNAGDRIVAMALTAGTTGGVLDVLVCNGVYCT